MAASVARVTDPEPSPGPTQPRGTIHSLDREKGCGRILGPDGGELYFHQSYLAGSGSFDDLQVGQQVLYVQVLDEEQEAEARAVHACPDGSGLPGRR